MILYTAYLSIVLLMIGVILSLYRMIKGPTALDQILGFESILLSCIGLIGVLGYITKSTLYFEFILIASLIIFFITLIQTYFLSTPYKSHGNFVQTENKATPTTRKQPILRETASQTHDTKPDTSPSSVPVVLEDFESTFVKQAEENTQQEVQTEPEVQQADVTPSEYNEEQSESASLQNSLSDQALEKEHPFVEYDQMDQSSEDSQVTDTHQKDSPLSLDTLIHSDDADGFDTAELREEGRLDINIPLEEQSETTPESEPKSEENTYLDSLQTQPDNPDSTQTQVIEDQETLTSEDDPYFANNVESNSILDTLSDQSIENEQSLDEDELLDLIPKESLAQSTSQEDAQLVDDLIENSEDIEVSDLQTQVEEKKIEPNKEDTFLPDPEETPSWSLSEDEEEADQAKVHITIADDTADSSPVSTVEDGTISDSPTFPQEIIDNFEEINPTIEESSPEEGQDIQEETTVDLINEPSDTYIDQPGIESYQADSNQEKPLEPESDTVLLEIEPEGDTLPPFETSLEQAYVDLSEEEPHSVSEETSDTESEPNITPEPDSLKETIDEVTPIENPETPNEVAHSDADSLSDLLSTEADAEKPNTEPHYQEDQDGETQQMAASSSGFSSLSDIIHTSTEFSPIVQESSAFNNDLPEFPSDKEPSSPTPEVDRSSLPPLIQEFNEKNNIDFEQSIKPYSHNQDIEDFDFSSDAIEKDLSIDQEMDHLMNNEENEEKK